MITRKFGRRRSRPRGVNGSGAAACADPAPLPTSAADPAPAPSNWSIRRRGKSVCPKIPAPLNVL